MRENTAIRLKKIMHSRNLKQVDILNKSLPLQKKYGIKMSKSHLSQYVNGKSKPDQQKLFLLARTLEVDEAWLMGYDINEVPSDDTNSNILYLYNQLNDSRKRNVYNYAENQLEEQNKKIVHLYGKTAAGEPITYGDDYKEELSVSYIPKHAECALIVQGDSMEPIIPNGSIVFYKKQPAVENGEIAIVEIEGDGVTCKKVKYDFENKKIILQSLNSEYEDMVLDQSQARILGKVIQ